MKIFVSSGHQSVAKQRTGSIELFSDEFIKNKNNRKGLVEAAKNSKL